MSMDTNEAPAVAASALADASENGGADSAIGATDQNMPESGEMRPGQKDFHRCCCTRAS